MFGSVGLNREVVIINVRLGLVYWVLFLCCLFAAIVMLARDFKHTFPLTAHIIEFWPEPKTLSSTGGALYCHANQNYTYDERWRYRPGGCEDAGWEQVFSKSSKSLFLETFVADDRVTEFRGLDCTSGAAQAACGGTSVTMEQDGDRCTCKQSKEYYVEDAEMHTVHLRHAFIMEYEDLWGRVIFNKGMSYAKYHEEGTLKNGRHPDYSDASKEKGKILKTIILDTDGEKCKVGGRSEFLPEHGDLKGPVGDWLQCGGYQLDDLADTAPTDKVPLRLTGAKMSFHFSYYNEHQDISGDVKTVCEVTVRVTPSWNSRWRTDHTLLRPESANPLPAGEIVRYWHRRSYGVAIDFEASGRFAYFNPREFIQTLVALAVLFSIPTKVVRFIACHLLGGLSDVYKNVLKEPFSVMKRFHGVCSRMMMSSMCYKMLTGQMDKMGPGLEAMTRDQVERQMLESMPCKWDFEHKRSATEGGECDLGPNRDEHIMRLSNIMMFGLDEDDGGSVEFHEFISACMSGESIDVPVIAKYFDPSRSNCCCSLEWLLDDLDWEVQAVRKRIANSQIQESAIVVIPPRSSSSSGVGVPRPRASRSIIEATE